MTFFTPQDHFPLLNNPPQSEDADIRDEQGIVASDEGAPSADASEPVGAPGVDESAGAELPWAGDSEDSDPLRIKRLRSSGADGRDATSGSGIVPPSIPPAGSSPSVAAPKRRRLGRLVRHFTEQTG